MNFKLMNWMKTGRNDLCSCGSGKKFKKCCINKEAIPDPKISISPEELLNVIDLGLTALQNIRVKRVSWSNVTTIVCEFYSNYNRAMEVRQEIGPIMGYFSGLFKDDLFENIRVDYFAVKAFDNTDTEILYAISTRAAADAAAVRNSIEWLKNTYIQENTPDYRLSRAKVLISGIEQTLRRVIGDTYRTKYGNDWWEQGIDQSVSRTVKSTYMNQFGDTTTDGDVLINYAYTLDLKKIVSADWRTFKHFFGGKTEFEDTMVRWNLIRREEAHNREITEQHLTELEEIHELLLSEILLQYPDIELSYMIDQWKSKIQLVMRYENRLDPVYTPEEYEQASDQEKCQLTLRDSAAQINYVNKLVSDLKSISIPSSKKQKHTELVKIIVDYGNLQEQKRDCVLQVDADRLPEILSAIQRQLQLMKSFTEDFMLAEG